jgi:hypothetical protein
MLTSAGFLEGLTLLEFAVTRRYDKLPHLFRAPGEMALGHTTSREKLVA